MVKSSQINTSNACQKLLKEQFPQVDGLLDTILLSNNDIPRPPTKEALQMHHIPGHWVMSCSFGGNVTVYDSANPTITNPLRREIAQVYSLLASGPDKLRGYCEKVPKADWRK